MFASLPLKGAEPWRPGAGVVVAEQGKAVAVPQWIWGPGKATGGEVVCFRREFVLPGAGGGGFTVTCDNGFRLWVNGKELVLVSDQHWTVVPEAEAGWFHSDRGAGRGGEGASVGKDRCLVFRPMTRA